MTFESITKDFLKKGIEVMFDLDKLRFNKISIKKEVLDEVCEYAKNSYPKEFLAFFHGTILNGNLILDRLIYHQYEASINSAVPIFQFNDRSFYGSVHSHPSHSNKPSSSDLHFFRKTGIVHCIICKPFSVANIAFYDHNGEEINVTTELRD